MSTPASHTARPPRTIRYALGSVCKDGQHSLCMGVQAIEGVNEVWVCSCPCHPIDDSETR